MTKRTITPEYADGAHAAVDFLLSWAGRPDDAFRDMGDEFMAQLAQMPQERRRGYQDALFLFVQWTLDGAAPVMDADLWLQNLENPWCDCEVTDHG